MALSLDCRGSVAPVSASQRIRPALRLVALFGVLLVSATGLHRQVAKAVTLAPTDTCPQRWSRRYEPLRQHLPRRGIVGYIGPELTEDGCNAKFIAQYVLAPVVVSHVWETDHRLAAQRTDRLVPLKLPLVIVDTADPSAQRWLGDNAEYAVVTDFGDGLLIASLTR